MCLNHNQIVQSNVVSPISLEHFSENDLEGGDIYLYGKNGLVLLCIMSLPSTCW